MLRLRRPTLHDLNDCLLIDAGYSTQRVWQMNQRVDAADISINFHLVHLPRPLTVLAPPADDNLLKYWQRGDCLFSARIQNNLAGYIHLIVDDQSKVGEIRRHVVAPDQRRQGIGTALLKQTLQWARDHRIRSLTVALNTKNHPASAFYLAHGFAFSGFSERFYSDQQIHLHFARSVR